MEVGLVGVAALRRDPGGTVPNGAFREVGGVFGVAILAVVFAQLGGLASPQGFANGFGPAMWVGAAVPALGIVAALLAPKRQCADTDAQAETVTAAEPVGVLAGAGGLGRTETTQWNVPLCDQPTVVVLCAGTFIIRA